MAELSSSAAVLEIGTAVPWVRKWSPAWVRSPLWDGFWMLSALWLAPIVLLLVHGYSDPESSPLDLLYFGLTALFWIGHLLSSRQDVLLCFYRQTRPYPGRARND